MNKKAVLLFVSILFFTCLYAQTQDQVLMKVNGKPVTKSEFEYLYHKNNTSSQQSLDEYLKLFIDYKLKVEEALTQKLDTLKEFTSEYENYKDQLTKPYMDDTTSQQTVARKLYDRLGENIEVSHILIRLPHTQRLLPKDTLAAYEKALTVRNKLLEKDARSFEEIAAEYSEDMPSERPGYLGWATAMMFVTPFEDGMYGTATGEVSMPVRSMFGYHLIKVHNRRKDLGKFNISHIMFSYPSQNPSPAQADSVKRMAEDVYAKIIAGGDYAELCKEYSTDKGTSGNGGNMGWIQMGVRLPQSFLDAVYTLKNVGDVTKPITTPFGYHIIKLEEKAGLDSWDQMKQFITGRVKNSDLSDKVNALTTERLSKNVDYNVNKETYNGLLSLANNYFPLDSSYIDITSADNKTLLTVGNENHSVSDFIKYIQQNPNIPCNVSTEFIQKALNNFTLSCLEKAYVMSLGDQYPEYRNLLREYHDGILLFNVMTQEVWDKASKDEKGLADYFSKNRNKYTWDAKRFKGSIIYCKDEQSLKEAKKIAGKNKKAKDLDVILKSTLNTDTTSVVFSKKGVWAKGENKFVDAEIFEAEEKPEPVKNYPLYFVQGRLIDKPEEYTDIKGLVISEYQEVREKEWMQSLRDKYPVEVDNAVLNTIK